MSVKYCNSSYQKSKNTMDRSEYLMKNIILIDSPTSVRAWWAGIHTDAHAGHALRHAGLHQLGMKGAIRVLEASATMKIG